MKKLFLIALFALLPFSLNAESNLDKILESLSLDHGDLQTLENVKDALWSEIKVIEGGMNDSIVAGASDAHLSIEGDEVLSFYADTESLNRRIQATVADSIEDAKQAGRKRLENFLQNTSVRIPFDWIESDYPCIVSRKAVEDIEAQLENAIESTKNHDLLQNAKIALLNAIKIESKNHKAIFQLGNILLMEKNYSEAIKLFNKSVTIKPDFWQAINNKGLAYFETDNMNFSIKHFEKAISIEENAEPLLGLASCLRQRDIKLALQLARKALDKEPNYVNYDYRKEQLWGEKLQSSTQILLQNEQLQKNVITAKSKINASS